MAKKPKRMSRKELRQQSELDKALVTLFEKVWQFRLHLVIGCAGLLGVGALFMVVGKVQTSSAREEALALRESMAPLTAPPACR